MTGFEKAHLLKREIVDWVLKLSTREQSMPPKPKKKKGPRERGSLKMVKGGHNLHESNIIKNRNASHLYEEGCILMDETSTINEPAHGFNQSDCGSMSTLKKGFAHGQDRQRSTREDLSDDEQPRTHSDEFLLQVIQLQAQTFEDNFANE